MFGLFFTHLDIIIKHESNTHRCELVLETHECVLGGEKRIARSWLSHPS